MSINQLLRPGDIPAIIFADEQIFFGKVNGERGQARQTKTGTQY
jgi:hypothetical protein